MTLDTTRADRMSVYGHPHRTTPRLEAFAARATRYRHAYANGDLTLSSHGSLFTGLYPTLHGAHVDTNAALGHCRDGAHSGRTAPEGRLPELRVGGESRLPGPDLWIRTRVRRVEDASPACRRVADGQPPYLLRRGVYKLTLPWLWTEAMRLFAPASEVASAGETMVADADGRPFFLFLNFMEPHRPWVSSGRVPHPVSRLRADVR